MGRESAVIGRASEDLAAAYLQERGYEILDRNFRGGMGELDIVCTKNKVIYFVEVKARKSGSQVNPAEALSYNKRRRIYSAAGTWLYKKLGQEAECSFLLLTIENRPHGEPKIEIFEDFLMW
jgi:putative endonuclease